MDAKKRRPSSGGPPGRGRSPKPAAAAEVAKSNPFEARTNKSTRFTVLGRKVKGAERNVAVSRSKAEERRAKALRQELARMGKANAFVDRRFGEDMEGLDAETKMLIRLQKERKRQLKVSAKRTKFNLEGEDGGGGSSSGGDVLTHFGKALSDADAFGGDRAGVDPYAGGDDSDLEGAYDAEVTAAHFGGPASNRGAAAQLPAWMSGAGAGAAAAASDRPKTYKEIMEEVIAKSKAARAERAEEKARLEASLFQLDMQFDSVAKLMRTHAAKKEGRSGGKSEAASAPASAPAPAKEASSGDPMRDMLLQALADAKAENAAKAAGKAAASPAAAPASSTTGAGGVHPSKLLPSQRPAAAEAAQPAERDEFDSLVLELATQSRAAIATNRLKTPEEVATEEAARLKELEALRRARMTGEGGGADPTLATGASSSGGGDDLGPDYSGGLTHKQRNRARGGVTLAETVEAARKATGGAGMSDDGSDDEDESDSDSSDDDDDDSDSEEDSEEDDDDDDSDDESAVLDELYSDAEEDDGEEDEDEEGDDDDDDEEEEEDEEDEEVTAPPPAAKRPRLEASSGAAPSKKQSSGLGALPPAAPAEMPFVVPIPRSPAELLGWVRSYAAPLLGASAASAGAAPPKAGSKRPAPTPEPVPGVTTFGVGEAGAEAAVRELLRRCRAAHSLLLGAGNRPKLEALHDVLLRTLAAVCDEPHAVTTGVAGAPPRPSSGWPKWLVTPLVDTALAMVQEGPLRLAAGESWRGLLRGIAKRVGSAIARGEAGAPVAPASTSSSWSQPAAGSPAWFTGGEFGLLRAAAAVFPTTDFRHAILFPLTLLGAQQLSQVPVLNETDAARGTLLAAALLDVSKEARRYVPEVVAWLGSLLGAAAAGASGAAGGAALPLALPPATPNFLPFTAGTVPGTPAPASSFLVAAKAGVAAAVAGRGASGAAAPLAAPLAGLLAGPGGASPAVPASRATAAATALAAAARITADLVDVLVPAGFLDPPEAAGPTAVARRQASLMAAACAPQGNEARGLVPGGGAGTGVALMTSVPAPLPCAPEVLDPLANALTALVAAYGAPIAPVDPLHAALCGALKKALAARNTVAAARLPMQLHDSAAPPPAIKTFAPLLEDPNQPQLSKVPGARKTDAALAEALEKEELRKLAKEKRREMRGAARELRRDREFVVRETDVKKAGREGERTKTYNKLLNELQLQESTFKQNVKKGGGLKKDGAAGGASKGAASAGGGINSSADPTRKDAFEGGGYGGGFGRTKADRRARKEASRAVGAGR